MLDKHITFIGIKLPVSSCIIIVEPLAEWMIPEHCTQMCHLLAANKKRRHSAFYGRLPLLWFSVQVITRSYLETGLFTSQTKQNKQKNKAKNSVTERTWLTGNVFPALCRINFWNADRVVLRRLPTVACGRWFHFKGIHHYKCLQRDTKGQANPKETEKKNKKNNVVGSYQSKGSWNELLVCNLLLYTCSFWVPEVQNARPWSHRPVMMGLTKGVTASFMLLWFKQK